MPAKVSLQADITNIQIKIIGEDGTFEEKLLIIEKKSDDVSIKEILGEGINNVEMQDEYIYVYVDEDLEEVDLEIKLNNSLASLKLKDEANYELSQMTRNVNLSNVESINLDVDVKAEAEEITKKYVINIVKQADIDLKKVEINGEEIIYNENTNKYEAVVPNGNKPEIKLTAKNEKHTVTLLAEAGTTLSSGTGVLNTTQTLTGMPPELLDNFRIKVISHHGEDLGSKEYNLSIRQKSKETGIIYVKVDNLGTMVSSDGLSYSSTVAGKDKYPVEIKLTDEKAEVRIEDIDGNIIVTNQKGILKGEIPVLTGETKKFKLVVKSENGEEKIYNLNLERISSSTQIESITVTDYDAEKVNIITKPVTVYNEDTKTYKVIVSSALDDTIVTVKTVSSMTDITIDNGLSRKRKH